jgi:hypothetical protein
MLAVVVVVVVLVLVVKLLHQQLQMNVWEGTVGQLLLLLLLH